MSEYQLPTLTTSTTPSMLSKTTLYYVWWILVIKCMGFQPFEGELTNLVFFSVREQWSLWMKERRIKRSVMLLSLTSYHDCTILFFSISRQGEDDRNPASTWSNQIEPVEGKNSPQGISSLIFPSPIAPSSLWFN